MQYNIIVGFEIMKNKNYTGEEMTKTKRISLTLLSLLGLALAVELCIVYYNANFAIEAHPSICAINELMDCDSVARTQYSQFFGIPLSLWGVLLYLFFLFMTFVDKLQDVKFLSILRVFRNPLSYIFCVGLLSFIVSMILGGISVLKINSVCVFCFMTYFVNLFIAICAKNSDKSILDEIKTCLDDFIEAIKQKRNALLLALIALLGVLVLTYTSISNIFTPQIAKLKELRESFDFTKVDIDGNTIGNKDARVIIEEYMDYNCGGCFIAQVYLHRVISEFENIKIIQHNVPLDSECNANVKEGNGHKNSCLKARYGLAAAKQNKYWQLGQFLFEPNVETEKDIIESARLLDLDIKKLKDDANSEETKQELKENIKLADSKGVKGTPTIYVGLKQIFGIGTYPEFVQTVIEQGGVRKNKQNE